MSIDDKIRALRLKGIKEIVWDTKEMASLLELVIANGFMPDGFHPAYFMNDKSESLLRKRFLEYKKPLKYMGVTHIASYEA